MLRAQVSGGCHYEEPWHRQHGDMAFPDILRASCWSAVELRECRQLTVTQSVEVVGSCSPSQEDAVVRVCGELVANTIRYGFYQRETGRIFIEVVCRDTTGIRISVIDDGWRVTPDALDERLGFDLLRKLGHIDFGASAAPFRARTAITVKLPPMEGWPRMSPCSARWPDEVLDGFVVVSRE